MDRTALFEELTAGRCESRAKRYTPLNETTSLVTKIYKMKAHLAKYGHDYLNTYGYLQGACVMTDERRAKLDVDVEEFIDSCHQKIKILQSEIRLSSCSQQVIEHREAVIRIVRRILNDLFTFFNHLRTTKIVRQMEKQKFDRIESGSGKLTPGQEYESIDGEISIEKLSNDENKFSNHNSTKAQQTSGHSVSFDDCRHQSLLAAEHHTSIDPMEIQELALENSQIHEELITLDDEVRLIGKKVVQISKLQELFTEKVMEQTCHLNQIHETAIASSENLFEGNELIRQAMMKNASTRVFILFYIVTLGFTILFLDWYNP
uniref:Syntaxin-18 n=1 Tax=Aceria tosichella TaxID=561515 RepID=A0A6G1SLJ3_9ACAR